MYRGAGEGGNIAFSRLSSLPDPVTRGITEVRKLKLETRDDVIDVHIFVRVFPEVHEGGGAKL